MSEHDERINSSIARQLAGGVSGTTLMRWAKLGIIPKPIKIRRHNYWNRKALIDALQVANELPGEQQ